MKDVMVDLETMGTASNAAIISIGAVEMDLTKGVLGKSLYLSIDLTSSVNHGLVMDPSTVTWWMQQSDEARSVIKGGQSLSSALISLDNWMEEDVKIWGNGAAFDNVILRSSYEACGMKAPWKFYNDRCYRTLKSLYPEIKIERKGVHHNALDDAISQAEHLIRILHRPARV